MFACRHRHPSPPLCAGILWAWSDTALQQLVTAMRTRAGKFPNYDDGAFLSLQLLIDRYIINAPTAEADRRCHFADAELDSIGGVSGLGLGGLAWKPRVPAAMDGDLEGVSVDQKRRRLGARAVAGDGLDCAMLGPEGLALVAGNANQPIATFGANAFSKKMLSPDCDVENPKTCELVANPRACASA